MRTKFFTGLILIVLGIIGISFVLANENALVVHPKGVIARSELTLILTNILLMLLIIVPTYILLFWVFWKYGIRSAKYDPDHSFGLKGELLMWGLPTLIVIVMALITWEATYRLNPYKPIESENKALAVQVIALDWKWLFIYPELGIATLNYLKIPEKTPIHLRLTADNSPMNSFWIPQLSGQIYSMTGMATQLFIMADKEGEYTGRAVEINGDGYSDMIFKAKSVSQEDFDSWVNVVKSSNNPLTDDLYKQLTKPFIHRPIVLFSQVEDDLFPRIVEKYMYPMGPLL